MKDAVLAVITLLKADTGVSGVVGSRVYRATLPPTWTITTGPAIVVTWISDIRDKANSTGRYAKTRIQVTAAAASDSAATNLSHLIATALSNLESTVNSGVYFVDADDAGAIPDNSDAIGLGVYRVNHDFLIVYSFV